MNLLTDVRAHLISQALVSSTIAAGSTWVCLIGGTSDKLEAPQVALVQSAGLPPLETHDGPKHQRYGLQVLVRGEPREYAAASAKVSAIYSALQLARFGGVLSIEARTSPAWLGYEPQSDRPLWSMNFIALT